MSSSQIKVRSHVGRDLLASAASFKTEASVVWEYVVNSLQYVEKGTTPKIRVEVRSPGDEISISDNGRGMDRAGLENFFLMHGENQDRLAGRGGRGKFGTGKSAAFGIATELQVDSIREGRRNVAVLRREAVEASDGTDIPVDWTVRDEATDAANGTTITIAGIVLGKLRITPIVEYIERHLQAFRNIAPQVAVNSHVCTYREPEVDDVRVFQPTPAQASKIGDVTLTIRIARAPLPDTDQGIAVTAGPGNLVAVEKGGVETKEFGNYLFGEVDVPALELRNSKIEPYDPSRSLSLNPQHPVVAVLLSFVGSKLEAVRSDLVRRAKEARKDEQTRRLEDQADQIADILNEDFRTVRNRLREIRSASARPGPAEGRSAEAGQTGDDAETWVKGTSRPGRIQKRNPGNVGNGTNRPAPDVHPRGDADPAGDDAVDPIGGGGSRRSRSRGGFRVQYKSIGRDEDRSMYDSTALTILINLDHPVVKAALGNGEVEDPAFKRLSYEIAFSEYAMGLGYEIYDQDPNIPADDLLYEVRSSLNRVAASAAALYR